MQSAHVAVSSGVGSLPAAFHAAKAAADWIGRFVFTLGTGLEKLTSLRSQGVLPHSNAAPGALGSEKSARRQSRSHWRCTDRVDRSMPNMMLPRSSAAF